MTKKKTSPNATANRSSINVAGQHADYEKNKMKFIPFSHHFLRSLILRTIAIVCFVAGTIRSSTRFCFYTPIFRTSTGLRQKKKWFRTAFLLENQFFSMVFKERTFRQKRKLASFFFIASTVSFAISSRLFRVFFLTNLRFLPSLYHVSSIKSLAISFRVGPFRGFRSPVRPRPRIGPSHRNSAWPGLAPARVGPAELRIFLPGRDPAHCSFSVHSQLIS